MYSIKWGKEMLALLNVIGFIIVAVCGSALGYVITALIDDLKTKKP